MVKPAEPGSEDPGYAPFAQLAKMLVPSSGSVNLYDARGELIWCSEGAEQPDLRELVDYLRTQLRGPPAVRQTATGITALTARLRGEEQESLGYVIIELGAERSNSHALAANLLKPLVECIRTRLTAERRQPDATATVAAGDLDFLIGITELEHGGQDALQVLLQRCVRNLDCESAAFVSPDQDVSVIAQRDDADSDECPEFVERTRKHLLAWAQLNNRPMVVNRVGNSPGTVAYKILSCPVRDASNEVSGLVALFREEHSPNFEVRDVQLLEFLCRRVVSVLKKRDDPLTGLLDRKTFEARLDTPTEATGGGPTGALLHINIDRLQAINDAFGLDAGDEVIRQQAELIVGVLGDHGIASRLSGNRFAVFLPGADEAQATQAAERLLDSISRLGFANAGRTVPVSVSIGIAIARGSGSRARHTIGAAEAAGKQARQEGGNRFAVHTSDIAASSGGESELIAAVDLREALQSSSFALVAQPIVRFGEALSVAGFEVLVRMPDESGSLLSPEGFMASARRYGLALGIDMWVFAELIRQVENFPRARREFPVGLAVNVSEQSLVRQDYARSVLAEIARSGLPGSLFSFEVSESAAATHMDAAEVFVETLRSAGCKVALDHFGSGLTSFAHLRRLNVDYLKVDGELIRGMPEDRHLESMVYGLAKAADSLNISMVAEHVESEVLAQKLLAMGFAYGQGFAFGRPQPLDEILSSGA